jgi:cob(I)alamin adenosyltransferase
MKKIITRAGARATRKMEFLKGKPPMLHVILTGRNAKPEIIEFADPVTEMREVKHPFQHGIIAQKGVEF